MGRRCIGMGLYREFAQVAVWENGKVRQAGQISLTTEALQVFVDSLGPEEEVAIEATCNPHAIVRLIAPRVARVVVSNPQKTRAIAAAKVKTDKVDAAILAELLAADFLPSVWVADEATMQKWRRLSHAIRRSLVRVDGEPDDAMTSVVGHGPCLGRRPASASRSALTATRPEHERGAQRQSR